VGCGSEFLADALKVMVKGRRVTLAGTPESNELGHDIVRRVRHANGVVAVRDRLSYPDDSPVIVVLGFWGRWAKRRPERGGSDEHD
jgi:hypothetical protein